MPAKNFKYRELSKSVPKYYNTAKVVLREKFIPLNAYIRKEGKIQINNLSSSLKKQ
jgi:hypothetical protein